jgi:hypothetical protein
MIEWAHAKGSSRVDNLMAREHLIQAREHLIQARDPPLYLDYLLINIKAGGVDPQYRSS